MKVIASIVIGIALGIAIYSSRHHIYSFCVDDQFLDYQKNYFKNLEFSYGKLQYKFQKTRNHDEKQSGTETLAVDSMKRTLSQFEPKYSPIGAAAHAPLTILDIERRIWACTFPPDGIYNGNIDTYSFPLPSECPQLPYISDDIAAMQMFWSTFKPKDELLKSINAVGRLEIRLNNQHAAPTFWASGFVIARNMIATTCHVMDPLLVGYKYDHAYQEELRLNLDHTKEDLIIDFGENRDQHDPRKECVIQDKVVCSSREGLDVALLKFDERSCMSPEPVPFLYQEASENLTKDHVLALVGYADFGHFIDADTYDLYKPYEAPKDSILYSKFIMPDSVNAVSQCQSNLKLLFDTVDTTVGQSGGPLIDLAVSGGHPSVAGIHTCCAAYFDQTREAVPYLKTSCSHIRRTIDNQDVSMESILADPILCREIARQRPEVKCH